MKGKSPVSVGRAVVVQKPAFSGLERAAEYAAASRSDATRKTYASVWRNWSRYCAERAWTDLPAAPISFAIFIADLGEVGRGGRYSTGQGEAAIGFTFLIDTLLPAVPRAASADKIYLPRATDAAAARALRAKGFITIRALGDDDSKAEAKRLGCTYYWDGKHAAPLDGV